MTAGADDTRALAAELRAALDDPARYEWGEGPWEHLGDAERDVRQLLDALDALAARVEELGAALRETARKFTLAEEDKRILEARLRDAQEALRVIEDTSPNWMAPNAVADSERRMREIARAALRAAEAPPRAQEGDET